MSYLLLPEFHPDTADAFLDHLSPLREEDGSAAWSRGWLFRGQDRDWPLLPKALRPDPGPLAELTNRRVDSSEARWLTERDALVNFFEIADERGLVLPDDSQQLRSLLETLASNRGDTFVGRGYREWIETENILSLMALAQHYGIPTRLLDWSRSAMIAAYFAAEGAIKCTGPEAPGNPLPMSDSEERMIVWAFYFPDLGKHDASTKNDDPVRIVTAPTASNPNLRAQRGVFSLLGRKTATDDDGDYAPMDQALERYASKYASDGESLIARCRMQKVSVPRREALRVLKRLALMDITPSVVYPGYSSIVDDLRMRVRYSRA